MTSLVKPLTSNWNISWIYTKEEWGRFEKWNARRKGMLNYLWYSLFPGKIPQISSVELTEQWVKIGDKRKYFSGPVTELKRVDISEKKDFNLMTITYEILTKGQLNEVMFPIPKGKLKEAIQVQYKLYTRRTMTL